MRRWFLPFLFLPIHLNANPTWKGQTDGGFSAEVTLSASQLTIEENLHIEVILAYPETYTVDLDKLRINLLRYGSLSEPPFALIGEESATLPNGKHKFNFTLEPQLGGVQFISLYDIPFLPKDPKKDKPTDIISGIFQVDITVPPVDEGFEGMASPLLSLTKKYPISIDARNRKTLLENPAQNEKEAARDIAILNRKTLPWGSLTGLFLFGLLVLIARMQPKRVPNPENERAKRALSAQNRALQALDELEKQKLLQDRNYEAYYIRLTDTVRRYIEEKFQLKATTQTTQEFLQGMAEQPPFDKKTQGSLKEFLVYSDKVKFAEQQPSPQACQEAHETARHFIQL